MGENTSDRPSRWFWIIAGLALIWTIGGTVMFLGDVFFLSRDALPDNERALLEAMPLWVKCAWGGAVFLGLFGVVSLLLRSNWAVPLLTASLVSTLAQAGYMFLFTELVAIRGSGMVLLASVVTANTVFLVWYSVTARRRGWLTRGHGARGPTSSANAS